MPLNKDVENPSKWLYLPKDSIKTRSLSRFTASADKILKSRVFYNCKSPPFYENESAVFHGKIWESSETRSWRTGICSWNGRAAQYLRYLIFQSHLVTSGSILYLLLLTPSTQQLTLDRAIVIHNGAGLVWVEADTLWPGMRTIVRWAKRHDG